MGDLRVVQFVNQFFGQVGGEEKASIEPFVKEGPVGVGQATQNVLGGRGRVVATVICGDNYAGEHLEEAVARMVNMIEEYHPDLVIAGPAFNAGRYGPAAGALCQAVQEKLGIPAVTGMYKENPGVELYREKVYIIETGITSRDMQAVIERMVELGIRLVAGEPIGKPHEEGYFSHGFLVNEKVERTAAERAVDMLIAQFKGEPIRGELKLAKFEEVAPAPPVEDLKKAKIALVTDGGLVPEGNPDKLEWMAATKYVTIDVSRRDSLPGGEFYANHTGYDTTEVNENPLRLVPLDALRELEEQGIIKELNSQVYSTTGVTTTVEYSQRIGRGIAERLKQDGVDAVILTSTWGTSTRCGATIAKEIERAGIPTAQITSLPNIAAMANSNRIVQAHGIIHPVGDASLPPEEEKKLRRQIVRKALQALQTKLEKQQFFK